MKVVLLSLVFVIPAAFAADTAADLQKKFVGSWRLVSVEGRNRAATSKPTGIIMYDDTGHMAVQIASGNRPDFPNSGARATPQEKAAAFDAYTAYYGTHTFEPEMES